MDKSKRIKQIRSRLQDLRYADRTTPEERAEYRRLLDELAGLQGQAPAEPEKSHREELSSPKLEETIAAMKDYFRKNEKDRKLARKYAKKGIFGGRLI